MKPLPIVVSLLTLFSSGLSAQENGTTDTTISSVSLGLRAGYSWPLGEWKEHRYAPVDHFGASFTIGGDFELRLSELVGLGIPFDYTNLDLSDWEDYTFSEGDPVKASASVMTTGLILRPYLRKKAPSYLKMEIGFMVSFASGKERGTYAYEYDFLKSPGFGVLVGLEYELLLSESIAFTIRGGVTLILSGASYADGFDRMMTFAPLTGGFRFHL